MMKFRQIFSVILLFGVVATGLYVFNNQQDLRDWAYLRNYTPSTEIEELANKAGLSEEGKKVFYVSDPKLNEKEEFNENCKFEERTIVLGCYDGYNIFVLDINDPKLDGIETVTAAHEMLHAAYIRLSDEEKQNVDALVKKQFETVKNQRILDLVAEYDTSDQELISNELHSILPTELEELNPELEAYYEDLFEDRQKVVIAAKKYESVFISLEEQVKQLQSQLDSRKSEIESLEQQISSLQSEIDTKRQELDELEQSGRAEEYNQLVPGFNNLIGQYNALIGDIKITIELHNQIVAQLNEVAVQQNNLVNTIDSNYQEL